MENLGPRPPWKPRNLRRNEPRIGSGRETLPRHYHFRETCAGATRGVTSTTSALFPSNVQSQPWSIAMLLWTKDLLPLWRHVQIIDCPAQRNIYYFFICSQSSVSFPKKQNRRRPQAAVLPRRLPLRLPSDTGMLPGRLPAHKEPPLP